MILKESKLPHVNTTIFSVMSKMAAEYQAINLSQGFPDFNCDEELCSLVNKYMLKGMNQYAPMPGIMPLREKISEKTEALYGVKYDPDSEVTVTSGATEALFAVLTAIVRTGDEVIVFEPAYDSYIPVIELNGGIAKKIALEFPYYSIDWQKVKDAISPKTRAIIINSPHNPTGAVLTRADLKQLSNLLADTNILLISDEVYEHILFDGLQHQSVMLEPELRKRTFVISSFGKTFHTTGWKLGYCLAPPSMTKELRKIHQFNTFCSTTPMQYAISEFLANKSWKELPDFYQEKRDKFAEMIKATRFKLLPCSGTYFQLLKYSQISEEYDLDFAMRLTREIGVAAIPVSAFYNDRTDHKILRFCFAKENETLEKAVEKLCKI